jgi:secreted trypsin-like serine protease
MKLVIGVLCLGLLSIWNEQSVVSAKNIGARIIGGQEAKDKQFPFMAAINVETDNSTYFCGGALITNEWILTSGQCLSGAVVLTVSLGSIALEGEDPNRVIITTSEFTIHPDFDPTTLVNDIALLKLQVSVSSDYIKPIKLAEINLPVILTPTALGWGQTKDDNNDLAPILNYVDVGVLTNEQCQLTYGSQIVDSMVCVGGSTNEGSCYVSCLHLFY